MSDTTRAPGGVLGRGAGDGGGVPAAGPSGSGPARGSGAAGGAGAGEAGVDPGTETRAPGPGGAPGTAEMASFGRYRRLRLLGAGGMGSVYEAVDPQLQRRVAVKVLHDRRPEAVERFLREARAQARVQHAGVCPIHEVGEVDGAPYLAMRLIEGATLASACRSATLEEKLLVVEKVALAVHEAHRVGLIHRDLKPSNVMVEENPGGEPRVFVLDFGIARAVEGGSDLTTDGAFLGTPSYSAPEQVRGDHGAIDRRTDVYSLGAMLYSALSGSPPFTGATSAVMMRVLETPPARLRPLGVPADVETIVMKCLEKDPERRYPSARAVAEELRRYLEGEPILARPVGRGERLVRWLRRRRELAATVLVALLVAIAALSWGGYTWWRATAREGVVRDLSAQVEGLEAEIRYSSMSPRHDIRPDQARLRQRMATIAERIDELGAIAEGPGHYALGRAHLALEDLAEARRQLQHAWDAGHRDPRVAHALGQTLSLLFRQGLSEARTIPDRELQAARRADLRQELEGPAVELMTLALGADEESDRLLEALIAFHQERYDDALRGLDGVVTPWRYEADLLRGDIHRELAQQHAEAGRTEAAEVELGRALEAYRAVQRTAPSDPRGYLAAGQLFVIRMLAEELTQADSAADLEAGLEQAAAAEEVVPEDARVALLEARLHHRRAEALRLGSQNPAEQLELALAAATRAAERAVDPSAAWLEAGVIQASRADWLLRADLASTPAATVSGLEALTKVAEPDRGYRYLNAVGILHDSRGKARMFAGEDARGDLEKAEDAYRAAVAVHPNPHAALSNLGQCLMHLALLPGTANPVDRLREAVGMLESAVERNPESRAVPCFHLGRCYLRIAQGGDPMSDLLDPDLAERSLHYYRLGQSANPALPHFASGIGEVLLLQAVQRWEQGEDPTPLLELAERELRDGIEGQPRYPFLHLNLSWVSYYRGMFRVREGRDPAPWLAAADAQAAAALELASLPGARLCRASVERMRAEAALIAGRDPVRHLERAETILLALVQDNPEDAGAHRALGRTLTLEARWLAASGGDPSPAFERAGEEIQRALALKPMAPGVLLAEARRRLRQAQWLEARGEPAAEVVRRGLEHADGALAARPGLAEAEAIRAVLELLGARTSGGNEGPAREALRTAIAKNPHLAFEWGSSLEP